MSTHYKTEYDRGTVEAMANDIITDVWSEMRRSGFTTTNNLTPAVAFHPYDARANEGWARPAYDVVGETLLKLHEFAKALKLPFYEDGRCCDLTDVRDYIKRLKRACALIHYAGTLEYLPETS